MKKHALLILSLAVMMSSCKKESPTTPVTPVTPVSPYYFKGTIDGSTYNLNANIPQYMPFYVNEAGGYQVADASLFPSIGLRFSWPSNDTVTESDILGLAGRTLYYSDTTIHPELTFDKSAGTDIWYSEDTSNTSYSVKVTTVTFLKKDTTMGYPLRTYVITGTCTGLMTQATTSVFSGGDFHFIICRRDL